MLQNVVYIALIMRGARMATQNNLQDGVDRMSSTIDTALDAADNVQKILIEMRTRASAVAAGNLTAAQVAKLNTEFQGLRDQITAVVGACNSMASRDRR